MGYCLSKDKFFRSFTSMTKDFDIWAPVLKKGEGTFSDIDVVRYDKVENLDEIEWEKRSDYSFKEALLKIRETIFYFTEDQTIVPKDPEKNLLIFLRACDLHALKRLDQIYLHNGSEDFYYARIREKAYFVLMECSQTCSSGFCVSMGTNQTEDYDAFIRLKNEEVFFDVKNEKIETYFVGEEKATVVPEFVEENKEKVTLPDALPKDVGSLSIWKEYGERCISCGRCNFVCPTCTCFTMQDIFYRDNAHAGERRRVWASCQVDGYDTIAGGHSFRNSKGDRFRFKVMHKIEDFKKRFGYTMCVGCGRCDSVCPEYISYSNLVNRLGKGDF